MGREIADRTTAPAPALEGAPREFSLRAVRAVDGLRLPGHVVLDRDLARSRDGRLWWLLAAPARRRWSADGSLRSETPVDWRLVQEAEGAVLRVADAGAEADVAELRGAVADAFRSGPTPEPLTISGTFRPLGGPRDLAQHLSARGPLMSPFGPGTRVLSEQVGLSLYRVARRRGGPFWDAAAWWIAEWGVARAAHVTAQSEMRFVCDLALLLLAAGEPRVAGDVLDDLEAQAAPLGEGTWYRHDRREVAAGRNDLVLNTHLQALVALAAAGRSVAPGQRALDHALGLRAPRARGAVLAARIALADAASATGLGGDAAWGLHVAWSRLRRDQPHLTLAPGFLARDATGDASGRFYRVVNLLDLATAVRVAPTAAAHAALRQGLWAARATGFLRVQRRTRQPVAVYVPALLRAVGHHAAADRAAAQARAAGLAPVLGWPGYIDAPWARLPPGSC